MTHDLVGEPPVTQEKKGYVSVTPGAEREASRLSKGRTEWEKVERTLVTKVERKHHRTTTCTRSVQNRGNELDSALRIAIADETRDTQDSKRHTKEEPRQGDAVEGFEVADHQPPHDGCCQVDRADNVQLVCRLRRLAREQRDLVRVDGQDLAKCHQESVDGPIAKAD